ncbi:acyclic terpene utilization AtuA family protein [Bordetella sp. BOR01]|uniref:acyclic terpene utilization AtuA family protein n=1 Tax=Bordetella sp. BOR01 TaxID=2854779 RepID=UPI0021060B7A|nr:acyclic terpene utilization AtuA family protein [Bordetella sp. BOR01]
MKSVRLGCGAAWARDRFDHAPDLVARGKLDYLCFDSMSEVTMSAAQVAKMDNASMVPYDPYLVERMRPILQDCKRNGTRIITNQGWLDPVAAARRLVQLAQELDIEGLKVAAVSGGLLHRSIADMNLSFSETGEPVAQARDRILSAEVYLGAEGIVQALDQGADIVITTRVADACVYLGPLAYEFGWSFDDCHAMARGMIIGHLMECGTQITGGYFADPGYKDVPDLANVGAPIAEVTEATAFITKLPETGGVVSEATCKEQLIYEVQDPATYFCPDCIADLTRVSFKQAGENRVEILMDKPGRPKTDTLKALIGLDEGFMTEEMVLFAGPGALARAQLTQGILHERFRKIGLDAKEMRMDYVGLNAVHRESTPATDVEPYEVVLRIAVRTDTRAEADKLRKEVDPLAVNGTYGTGKWSTTSPGSRVRPVVGLSSALVPRQNVPFEMTLHTRPG